jgi:hypothetical protein
MTQKDNKPSKKLDLLQSQAGSDAILAYMLEMKRPLTVETYLEMNYPDRNPASLGPEEIAEIPEGLSGKMPNSAHP